MIRSKVKVKEAKIDRCCDEHGVNVNCYLLKAKLFFQIPIVISSINQRKLSQNFNCVPVNELIQNKILNLFNN